MHSTCPMPMTTPSKPPLLPHAEDGNRIIEAAKQEDWDAVHDINHALKGVSGNLAADELFALCSAIDHKIKDGYSCGSVLIEPKQISARVTASLS